MPEFLFGFALGAIAASAAWWAYVRGIKGVVSDLKDAKADATKVVDKAKGG